ncbi:MAG: putative quinol monooxygenase [Alphaproteobacteria bacterium]
MGKPQHEAGAERMPVTVINVFTPRPGRLEDLVAVQQAALPGFRGRVPGLLGSRFYRALDGRNAVLVSVFETPDDFQQFRGSDLFAAHRDRISPLLEGTNPGLYELVYEAGEGAAAG